MGVRHLNLHVFPTEQLPVPPIIQRRPFVLIRVNHVENVPIHAKCMECNVPGFVPRTMAARTTTTKKIPECVTFSTTLHETFHSFLDAIIFRCALNAI